MPNIYKQRTKYEGRYTEGYCPQQVAQGGRMMGFHQCSRKGKYEEEWEGKMYKWCKQHLPSNVKAKRDAEAAKWHAESAAKEAKWQRQSAELAFCAGVDTEYLRTHSLKDLITQLGELTDLCIELDPTNEFRR